MKVLQLVSGCEACPRKVYYSGGRSECIEVGTILPPLSELAGRPAEWCPLPEYPAAAMERLREENAALRRSRPAMPKEEGTHG